MRYFIVILLCISFKADGQIIRSNPFYTSRALPVATDTLLLDSFPNAAAAYSLRKLRTSYTGNCIKVRRSSDNTTQDIGFVNNYLDTASMKTFVGNNSGFIDTWYDQGDSARNATQTTTANQPRIVNSGTLEYRNNKISINFISSSSNFLTFTSINRSGTWSWFGALASNSIQQQEIYIQSSATATAGQIVIRLNNSSKQAIGWSSTIYTSTNNYTTNPLIFTGIKSGSTSNWTASFFLNGTSNGSTFSTQNAFAIQPSAIGRRGANNAAYANSNLYEIIFYVSDKTSDRSNIENNINRNWLIY